MLDKKSYESILITLIFTSLFIVILLSAHLNIFNLNNEYLEIGNEDPIVVNNNNAPNFVESNNYSFSSNYAETNGFETKKNVIKTKEGNKNYTFKTEFFLPMDWEQVENALDPNEYWYNCQSVAINGKYMYVLSSSGYDLNNGFIVRYDMNILNESKTNNENENGLDSIRKLGYVLNSGNYLSENQTILKEAIKVGPVFNTGHGQSLSYNPKTNSLWMWQDDDESNSSNLKLMSIDMNTLEPNKTYKVPVKYNNREIEKFRNLDFDSEGNFYTEYIKKTKKNTNGSSIIFTGNITNDTVEIKELGTIKNRPGTFSQSLGVNRATNRLYLVSDSAFYTMPLNKLKNGTLAKNDFHYTVFDTNREFEGISFDEKGNSYLLVLRGTEILKSNQT